ncbi:hypothetical protein I2800192A2_29640 [Anaerostipes hadrus]|uniref:hypothetical protein n=1 Tax=Anaerostipes hadrus TaxID=649756 RepID=UPI0034B53B5A
MIARRCDICGEFFEPYLASNAISREKDSYYRIEVKKSTFINGTARTRQKYDVCMECEKKFINWVEGEKRKAKE